MKRENWRGEGEGFWGSGSGFREEDEEQSNRERGGGFVITGPNDAFEGKGSQNDAFHLAG